MRRQRVEWAVLILALLVVAGVGGLDLHRDREALGQRERDRIEHNADAVAGNIGRQLKEIDAGLELLRSLLHTPSGRPDFDALSPARLDELAATMGGASSITIADADTTIVASTAPELVGRSFRGSERDRTMRAGRDPRTLYVFPPYATPLGRYTISVAKVLLDERGQFGGFVFAGLDPAYFDTVLKSGLYGPADLRLGLVHGGGRVVYRVPVEEGLAGIDLSENPESLFMRHRGSGQPASVISGIATGSGEHRLTAFRTIDLSDVHADRPLIVYASRVVDAMFAPWRREVSIRGIFFAALSMALAVGLAYVQRRRRAFSRLEQESEARRRQAQEADSLRKLTQALEARVAERTTQLEAASAAKSAFLANMSHEIRTPLNAILGLAQLLEQKVDDPEDRDSLGRIRDAGDVLLRTVNDVLDLSKIEAGRLEIEQQPFRVAHVLAKVQSLVAGMASHKGLPLRVEAAAAGDLNLVGDAIRLEQVLLNLVSNAIKFTAAGEIVLRVGVPKATPTHVRLRFEVEDTGIGIPAAKVAALFAPFTQADAGIARRFGGTGLGLAISKRLVELMGGAIGVESTEGRGSTFWFELPFGLAACPAATSPAAGRAAATPAPPAGPQLAGLRVLVVDDSPMNLDVVERLLKRDGAAVTRAGNGQEALAVLRARPQDFNVVLMDIQMPVMDGLAATREIRADPSLHPLPVIALTAGVMAEERAAATQAGVDDVLPKPLDIGRMRALLARYLAPIGPATRPAPA